jgi:hypothetical protein
MIERRYVLIDSNRGETVHLQTLQRFNLTHDTRDALTDPEFHPSVKVQIGKFFTMSLAVKAQGTVGRAFVALTVACVLLLQIAILGLTIGSVSGGTGGAFFSVNCASPQMPTSDGVPAVPATTHQHGFCCILHGAAPPIPRVEQAPSVVLARSEPEPTSPPHFSIDAIHLAPELAPLSARAPPRRAV